MLHDALAEVVIETRLAEDFGHRAGGATVVFEQLFEPVFGLGVADGEGRVLERGGEDVRDAELVAIDCGAFVGTRGDVRKVAITIPAGRWKEQRMVVASWCEVLAKMAYPMRLWSLARRSCIPAGTILLPKAQRPICHPAIAGCARPAIVA